MKALISTMVSPSSLFIARRLRDFGFTVVAADPSKTTYGLYSNAVSQRKILPSLHYNPRAFVQELLQEITQGDYDIYIPTLECGYLMSYYQDLIQQHTRMISMPYELIQFVHNKTNLPQLADKCQIPVPPQTHAPENLEQAEEICRGFTSSAIIKLQTGSNANGQKVIMNPKEIWPAYKEIVKQYHIHDNLPLIQQFIKGSLVSTVNLTRDGKLIGKTTFKSLRTLPVNGGMSSYRVTYNSPTADDYDKRIISQYNWTGFISMDYMQDEETGELFLIDCNPRPAPGIILGYNAGVDLLGAYVDMLLNREIRTLKPQTEDVRGKMEFLDLGWMLFNLIDSNLSPRQRAKCFWEWVRPKKCYGDVFSIKDLKPTIALYYFILRNIRKLLGPESGEFFMKHVLYDETAFNPEQEEISL